MTSIWWIRRDLRLTDNLTLHAALKAAPVIPVFILDPHLRSRTPARRQNFLFEGLHALQQRLAATWQFPGNPQREPRRSAALPTSRNGRAGHFR